MSISNSSAVFRETLSIQGMTCASCVGRVEKALKKVDGVEQANVNLATEQAVVESSAPLDRAALVKAVERAGYDVVVAAPIELSIDGMTCASCVARVEKALKKCRVCSKPMSIWPLNRLGSKPILRSVPIN